MDFLDFSFGPFMHFINWLGFNAISDGAVGQSPISGAVGQSPIAG